MFVYRAERVSKRRGEVGREVCVCGGGGGGVCANSFFLMQHLERN